ncbi:MAG: NAD-dependent DNA ligase LigA [Lachnospiraceae bacterium]|nr:NAD-dependent DNA ligase LigA [Lachnospiraceae bacterium]
MSEKEKIERIKELVTTLSEAARVYEQEDREIMSNFEYDKLYDELLSLEKETGYVQSNSPTQKVGYEVISELPKERHASPMLSLDKTKEPEVLKSFIGEQEALLSWKMDGLTNVLTYNNGELVKAVTRGNGEVGEIITNNARVYKNVPLRIPYTGELVIRGEAIITYSEFERINSEITDAESKYKNPRNLCSGSVRQLNNAITAERNVQLYVFGLISTNPDMGFKTRHEGFDWLREMGFTCVEQRLIKKDNFEEVFGYFKNQVAKNDFPSDGLVLSYDNLEYSVSLGRTAKFPRDSIAFKWQDETARTHLIDIEWSASRTGLINPVAIFEPVELEGTTVSRASLHNVSIMEGLQLGIGDELDVYKANMIIPQISENYTRKGGCVPPAVCPVCGLATRIQDEDGVRVLLCDNPNCAAKKIKGFTLFVSRNCMNIDGLSESTFENWVNEGILHEPADFFRLASHKEKIVSMEGFGEKSYENIINAADKARHTDAARVLAAIGVPNIGTATAKLICKHFNYDMSLITGATEEELLEIDGVGDVTARDYVEFFKRPENIAELNNLLGEIVLEKVETDENAAVLSGLTFVITGSVALFKNRNELKNLIEALGGKVTGSVTKNTDYLINNDSMSNSTKNKTAKELGVKIITEEEFMKLKENEA